MNMGQVAGAQASLVRLKGRGYTSGVKDKPQTSPQEAASAAAAVCLTAFLSSKHYFRGV